MPTVLSRPGCSQHATESCTASADFNKGNAQRCSAWSRQMWWFSSPGPGAVADPRSFSAPALSPT